MNTWEQVLLGIGGLLVLVFFWPGMKAVIERSRQAEERDWPAAIIPLVLVVLFVILLIIAARS